MSDPTASGPPLLEIRNLRIEIPTRKGTLVAVDDVSFAIDEGEVLGVVGESGAGTSLTGAAIIVGSGLYVLRAPTTRGQT